MKTKQVLKINSALSSKPFFVNVSGLENPSLDTIGHLAIQNLTAQGRPLEAQQLEQLWDSHQIFNGNQVQTKGTLFDALAKTNTMIGEQPIEMVEINLLTAHAGGTDSIKGITLIFKEPVKEGCQYLNVLTKYLLMTSDIIEVIPSVNTAMDDIALMKAKHDLKMQLYASLR